MLEKVSICIVLCMVLWFMLSSLVSFGFGGRCWLSG